MARSLSEFAVVIVNDDVILARVLSTHATVEAAKRSFITQIRRQRGQSLAYARMRADVAAGNASRQKIER